MRVSLLLTTYNEVEYLCLVLQSIANQTRLPDEIVICDDGSSFHTTYQIRLWSMILPIRHIWISDLGFRPAFARNLGIFKAQGDLLIFVDGDCLLPPSFVECHLRLAKFGYVVSGGRYLLNREETLLMRQGVLPISSAFNYPKFLKLPLGPLRNLTPKRWKAVRTCNLSLYRNDAIRVAGFDENYVGWGLEDSDFVVRLVRSGIKIRMGRLAACVAHLHHVENTRERLSVNEKLFNFSLENRDHLLSKKSILKL